MNTDFYMITEHRRKDKKGRVKFNMVINKVLITSLVITTLATGSLPAYANNNNNQNYKTATVEQQYHKSIDNIIYEINSTISQLKVFNENYSTKSTLSSLINQVRELEEIYNKDYTVEQDKIVDVLDTVIAELGNIKNTKEEVKTVNDIRARIMKLERVQLTNPKSQSITLSDISNHWGKSNIERLVSLGAINGYSDGTFKPDNTISFAEFLKIAVSSVEKNVQSSPAGSHWASGVYQTAIEKGIINSHEFKGTKEVFDRAISREDAALILIRINEKVQKEERVDTSNTQGLITDFSTIGNSRKDAVLQSYEKGLLSGKGNGFDPKGSTTRAEASTIVVRLLDPSTRVKVEAPTQPAQPAQDNIVITEGRFAGRMRIEKATEYHLNALGTANFYQVGGKYYVSIDLPDLPQGFKWRVSVGAYDKDGSYIFATMNKDYTGVTGKQVIEVYSEYAGKTVKDIDVATLGVFVMNDKAESMLLHRLSTKAPNQVLRQSSITSADASWETFNTNGIFNWK